MAAANRLLKLYGTDEPAALTAYIDGRAEAESAVSAAVTDIIGAVKKRGDAALFEYALRFDGARLNSDNLVVSPGEIRAAYEKVAPAVTDALRKAAKNILDFNNAIKPSDRFTGGAGARTGYVVRPVSRAGIYVPGGKAAYPSSVLMCALPARAANVPEIIMTTPVKADLTVNPLVLIAADICGVKAVYKVGGAQAIAAMAYGTESVPRADIVTGPGNAYVAAAKRAVYGAAGIDSIAGPSEIVVIADDSADPEFIAADLLSQAEHDESASAVLITDSAALADKVEDALSRRLETLSRRTIARASLAANGAAILCASMTEAVTAANRLAPEHLELFTRDPHALLPLVVNAGAVFLGRYSPEPLGDYFAGPNHVLPTAGTARFSSALSAENYVKRISVIDFDRAHLAAAADSICALAGEEGLTAHAEAVRVRLENDKTERKGKGE
jgi:histidinol dehydrogenase